MLFDLFGQKPAASLTQTYRIGGTDVYTILYKRQSNGTYKLYCTKHPRNPKDKCPTKCHLYASGEICITAGKEPRTLDKAKAIGMAFCKGYSQYIRTGTFPNGARRVDI